MTDILANYEVDGIALRSWSPSISDIPDLITSHRAQAARIEELERERDSLMVTHTVKKVVTRPGSAQ